MADLARGDVDLATSWRALFAEYDPAAETMAAACARRGLSTGGWYYWRKKLGIDPARSGRRAKHRTGFVEVLVQDAAPVPQPVIEIAFRSGAIVRVGAGAGARELEMVLRALGGC